MRTTTRIMAALLTAFLAAPALADLPQLGDQQQMERGSKGTGGGASGKGSGKGGHKPGTPRA